jgi:hypothetical protein
LWWLALQNDVSVGNAWTASELSHIHQYKITALPVIKPMNYEKRVRVCNWFVSHVHDTSWFWADIFHRWG